MGAQKITEQQFRTRRRDRRMVWVDALAFAAGLLIVAVSVAGVVLIEPEQQPIDWTYTFAESRLEDRNICVGIEYGEAERRGCASAAEGPLSEDPAAEGEPIEYAGEKWYVSAANVTSVTFELSWQDDPPITGDGCEGEHCRRNYDTYDDNSTDTLRLDVYAPNGDHFWGAARNTPDPANAAGAVRIRIPILAPEGGNISAFTQREAADRLNETHYAGTHDAIGQWRTVVTVIRAGNIEGTVPINACTSAGVDTETQNQTGLNGPCHTYDAWKEHSALAWYSLLYGSDTAEPFRDQIPYSSSWVDEGSAWQLKMVVRTYNAIVTL